MAWPGPKLHTPRTNYILTIISFRCFMCCGDELTDTEKEEEDEKMMVKGDPACMQSFITKYVDVRTALTSASTLMDKEGEIIIIRTLATLKRIRSSIVVV